MRIAILTSFFYHQVAEYHGQDRIIYGGAEKYLVNLCHLLQEDGHEVAVYQAIDAPESKGEITKNYRGIPIICLPVKGDWSYSTNPRLNMIFNEIAGTYFDLRIYFATFCCWPHVVLPAISISHGIFWDYEYHLINTLNEIDRKEFFRRQLYGFTAPDVCVAVDSNVRKVIQAISPGDEQKIRVIYNFVDTEKFKPAPKTWDGIRVLYPRRLTVLRGCNEFIKASRELPQYEFLAVGQAHDEQINEKVKLWGETTPNIRFVWKPMDGMEEIYQSADISVVPTRASEGLSLSLLESMACGLPVITTPVGGLGDAIIDGYNGLIYDPNHDDLTGYIQYLAENEDLRRKFGERNRQIAVECFNIQIWRAQWRELIRRFA
jgi:glycosyltransferase involved in cell wall biosynthesis